MRLLLAVARAQSLPTAFALTVALVLMAWWVGRGSLPVPFLQDAVRTGRLLPVLFAAPGASVVASDWRVFERTGVHPPSTWVAARVVLGSLVALGGATCASWVVPVPVLGPTAVAYAILAFLAVTSRSGWWWAVPVLLYALLMVPPDLLPR